MIGRDCMSNNCPPLFFDDLLLDEPIRELIEEFLRNNPIAFAVTDDAKDFHFKFSQTTKNDTSY
jgi:hypothetical protein